MARSTKGTPATERLSSGMYWLIAATLALPPLIAVLLAEFIARSAAIGTLFIAWTVALALLEIRYLKVTFRNLASDAQSDGEFSQLPTVREMAIAPVPIIVTAMAAYQLYYPPEAAFMVSAFVAIGVLLPIFARATWWQILLSSLVVAGILILVDFLSTQSLPPEVRLSPLFLVGWSLGIIVVIVISTRFSLWSVWVAFEQQRLRTVAGQLAIAEERLRISRDLHDIFGRTLTSINLKSELAAELIRVGQAEAAQEHIGEISTMAREASSEVRSVVSGYRSVDLASELQGAAATLRTAGIDVELTAADVPEEIREPLAWAVREGATNVLRHSAATTCQIQLTNEPTAAVLTIRNDSPHPPRHASGTGLLGLGERLAPLGGTVERDQTEDSFALTITIPHEVPHD